MDLDELLEASPKPKYVTVQCPKCGRFSAKGWMSPDYWGEWSWGGICKTHGRWSE